MAFEVIQQITCDRQGEVLNPDGNQKEIPVYLLKAQIIEAVIDAQTGEISEGNPIKEIGMDGDSPFMICEKCKDVCIKYFDSNLKTQGGPKNRKPRTKKSEGKKSKKKEPEQQEIPTE